MKFVTTRSDNELISAEIVFDWEEYKSALFSAMRNKNSGQAQVVLKDLDVVQIVEKPGKDRIPEGVSVHFRRKKGSVK